MKKNNYTLGQLICTSLFSAFVAILSVMAALTVKPHATAQASVSNPSAVATIAQPHAVVIFEAPTVANVEILPEAEAEATAAAVSHHQTANANANPSEGDTLTPEEIQRVKDYIMAHRVHVDIVEMAAAEPAQIIAAK